MHYAYVISPYSHENPDVEKQRYETVLNWCARNREILLDDHWCQTFSPIVYGYQFHARGLAGGTNQDWLEWNHAMMSNASGFVFLKIAGHEKSLGCTYELGFAAASGKPVNIIEFSI